MRNKHHQEWLENHRLAGTLSQCFKITHFCETTKLMKIGENEGGDIYVDEFLNLSTIRCATSLKHLCENRVNEFIEEYLQEKNKPQIFGTGLRSWRVSHTLGSKMAVVVIAASNQDALFITSRLWYPFRIRSFDMIATEHNSTDLYKWRVTVLTGTSRVENTHVVTAFDMECARYEMMRFMNTRGIYPYLNDVTSSTPENIGLAWTRHLANRQIELRKNEHLTATQSKELSQIAGVYPGGCSNEASWTEKDVYPRSLFRDGACLVCPSLHACLKNGECRNDQGRL